MTDPDTLAARRHWLARVAFATGAGAAALLLPAGLIRAADGAASAPAAAGGKAPAGEGAALIRPLATRSLVLAVTRAGQRLVAVGERGHVLLSDDEGKQWRQAKAVPTRNTLTCLHAVDATHLWAAGHAGTLLRSDDAGETWRKVASPVQERDVLLSIRVEPGGRGLAVGGFGVAITTSDGGEHWQGAELIAGEEGERHLNQILVSAKGTWLIAAEAGHVLRSADAGATWKAIKTPYAGSLWSGVALANGGLLACGMRGNLVRSSDDGLSWTHQAIPGAGSLTAAVVLRDQRVALVGVDGTVVIGNAAGDQFVLHRQDDRATLNAAVLVGADLLAVGSATGLKLLPLPG
ncbi:MAG: hypothetical protein RL375_2657 [Pseudomonadota bacterium]